MSFLQMLADLATSAAESIGAHQAAQQQQTQGARTVRRKSAQGCTPCAAMAEVDKHRNQLGFGKTGKAKKK